MAAPLDESPTRTWLHSFADYYSEDIVKDAHPEVMKWPMVGRDVPVLQVMLCYSLFVNWLGPAFMRSRKPFDLRRIMVPYNIVLVIANLYIFIQYVMLAFTDASEVRCESIEVAYDVKKHPNTFRLAEVTWYFYMTKYAELFDTVFFVLRKKDRQLSRLHIIHHTAVPFMIFAVLRSEPGAFTSCFPLLNSFVHVIMYAYYGISALGDDVTIHLKFKKYVTMTQMIQFILVLYYFISRPFYSCKWNPLMVYGNLCIATFFFILFSNFYWNEYCKNRDIVANGIKSKSA